MHNAKEYIINVICKDDKPKIPQFEIGSILDGEIKRILDFGMFVEVVEGVEGLLHKSKLNSKNLEDFKVGDKIKVKVLSQSGFKIELMLVDENV